MCKCCNIKRIFERVVFNLKLFIVNFIQFIMQKILKIHRLSHLCSKNLWNYWGLSKNIKKATQFPRFFFNFLSLLNFQWPNFSIFIDLNFVKPPQCTPYSSRAFQRYQEHDKRALWFGDLNMTRQTKPNQNTFPNRRRMSVLHYLQHNQTHTLQTRILHAFSLSFLFFVASKLIEYWI
jgi:hypothetical protein